MISGVFYAYKLNLIELYQPISQLRRKIETEEVFHLFSPYQELFDVISGKVSVKHWAIVISGLTDLNAYRALRKKVFTFKGNVKASSNLWFKREYR